MRCADATVLVTGASGGIGRAVAGRLYQRGARLVLHGRDRPAVDALAAEFGARAVYGELAAPAGAEELAAAAGAVDVLVHCAGAGLRAPLPSVEPAEVDRLLDVNLGAPIRLARALLPPMLDAGRGHLAFVASVAGLGGVGQEAVYAASKAGLLAFAASLRLEVAGTGVEVSTVSPAAVDTGFWAARGTPYHRSRPRPLPPERVAGALVRGLERGGGDRVVPRWLRAAAATAATAPGWYAALAARLDG